MAGVPSQAPIRKEVKNSRGTISYHFQNSQCCYDNISLIWVANINEIYVPITPIPTIPPASNNLCSSHNLIFGLKGKEYTEAIWIKFYQISSSLSSKLTSLHFSFLPYLCCHSAFKKIISRLVVLILSILHSLYGLFPLLSSSLFIYQ